MTDNEKLSCLIDRPCNACKFHKEEGCSKWSCVFEEKSDVPEREKGECKECKWYDEERIYNVECENCSRSFEDNFCRADNRG